MRITQKSLVSHQNYHIFASLPSNVNMKLSGNIKNYITNTLGFELEDKGDMRKAIVPFPALITNFFAGNLLTIEGIEHVLVKSHLSDGSFPMSLLIKRIKSAEEKLQRPCILCLDTLDGDQRRQLIKHKICFVIPERQIYLPTMGTYFTEKRLNAYKEASTLTPAAQLLILYHLQKEQTDNIGFQDLAMRLNYPPKTISLIASELQQAKLCNVVSLQGRVKGIAFKTQGRNLWNQALPMMSSPILKVGYLPSEESNAQLCILSYDDALSHYTDMAQMPQHSYAVERRSETGKQLLAKVSTTNLSESKRIEFWKYNPATLAQNGYIDPLSMILIYKDHEDERIQGQIERLIEKIL